MNVILKLVWEGDGLCEQTASLAGTYGSRERLRQRLRREGLCASPDAVDDLELWEVALAEDGVVETYVSYPSAAIFGDLTPRRLDLLQLLAGRAYESITSLVQDCDRDYKNVYDDLRALQRWGLVDLIRRGKRVVPSTKVAELKVSLD